MLGRKPETSGGSGDARSYDAVSALADKPRLDVVYNPWEYSIAW